MKRLEEILRDIEAVDEVAKRQCEEILNSKMKPKGSLGVLEKTCSVRVFLMLARCAVS